MADKETQPTPNLPPNMRIGKNQLRSLIMVGSPTMRMVSTPERGLLEKGLMADTGKGYAITPAGLRTLADEMESGRVDAALEAMRSDAEARGRAAAARKSLNLKE